MAEASPLPSAGSQPGGTPTVASTITVPPAAGGGQPEPGEGGEWDLLVSKLRHWLSSGQAAALWHQARTPLVLLGALVALLMVLRVYGALIGAIDGIPLLPGLLELTGLLWLAIHGAPRLLRSSDRQELAAGLRRRWQAFQGR